MCLYLYVRICGYVCMCVHTCIFIHVSYAWTWTFAARALLMATTSMNGKEGRMCVVCLDVSRATRKCECGAWQYCSRQCQIQHWPEHRSDCEASPWHRAVTEFAKGEGTYFPRSVTTHIVKFLYHRNQNRFMETGRRPRRRVPAASSQAEMYRRR